jgi:hypothetical protein
VPTYTFTVFDGAGNDIEQVPDLSSPVCKYIQSSQAMILVLDPLILSRVKNGGAVDERVIVNSRGSGSYTSSVDVVNIIANYIRNAKYIRPGKIIDIPVAVVLTKFDAILSHSAFGSNALVKISRDSFSEGKVNMSEIQQINQEICSWLEDIGERSFVDAFEANFKEFIFFGVSSFGKPPEDDGTLDETINPHRVLDPILWLFKNAKFVD